MNEKKLTAEEIYLMIDNQSVNKEVGTKLIENYGIQQQKEFINKLQDEYPACSEKIIETIKRINDQLDEMLKNAIGDIN
jgi:hypothetical protein